MKNHMYSPFSVYNDKFTDLQKYVGLLPPVIEWVGVYL